MTPTPEQIAIIEAARDTSDNLLISAYAGAAKTTTLELMCKAMPGTPTLSIAFNKRIAEEMTKRLPGHVRAQTLNSVGHRVWGTAIGKRLVLHSDKLGGILKSAIADLPGDEQSEAYDNFGDIIKIINAARNAGYCPERYERGICTWEQFYHSLDDYPPKFFRTLLDEVIHKSIQAAFDGTIDFSDQIYMPTLFGGTFPKFPLVMVDEAQDLSPLNHVMLAKLVTQRVIAVGDPYQSIYAFRGAVVSGMDRLRERFNMRDMTLSVSFRCPQAIVRRAWFRVPDMKWPEWAAEGLVVEHDRIKLSDIEDGAAIICRHNAPLFHLGFNLIRSGRGVQLIGFDIGPGLVRILRKLGEESMPRDKVHEAITAWAEAQAKKTRRKAALEDRVECLRVFADQGPNLGAAIAYAEHLFRQTGSIQLLSGHKSKGLEWDVVYHLDPWRCGGRRDLSPEDMEQELNIRYVIETRAKKELHIVNMENIDV
jgi:superfamily I DNA/RNA helicase